MYLKVFAIFIIFFKRESDVDSKVSFNVIACIIPPWKNLTFFWTCELFFPPCLWVIDSPCYPALLLAPYKPSQYWNMIYSPTKVSSGDVNVESMNDSAVNLAWNLVGLPSFNTGRPCLSWKSSIRTQFLFSTPPNCAAHITGSLTL